jgi:two-component system, cell cycle sensor histidine kinase and response regulator CckA
MIYPPVYSVVLSLLPCAIPPYAIRLNRAFGTQRVGWGLVSVFSLLALQQVARFWFPLGLGFDPELTRDLLNFLVPVLLLIGMVHIETLFRERARVEQEEKRLRAELEVQVQERTAEVDKANDELHRELSLRRQGEQELKKSKEQYRFLFDENPQPMWIFDRHTYAFLAFNGAAPRHYGFSGAEWRALTARDLCLSDDYAEFAADAQTASPEVQRRGLWRHRRKDGSVVEVELTALDLVYAERPARLILAHDVTPQRMLQKQLLQNQKMELTNQLAGGVADNFGQLLCVIEGYATALVQKCHDPAAMEPLKRVAATASAASGLTRQLLALVKRHPMQPQLLDLARFLEAQTPALSRLAGEEINVEQRILPGPSAINGDPALIAQILHNLVANARDAMPNGGTLTLSLAPVQVNGEYAQKHEARPGDYARLTVSDTGCGMTPEVQEHLFEPFFTTKDHSKGRGLGLATVDGLVTQHGGWIEVNSQPGVGSHFSVFFPCVPSAAGTET